ncbi:MAG: YkgJ family cysteine cluster protein [Fimbriimonadaceae bacterium]|nr:YkgJ family cysteine cluster protein [Fimbriimonadaceae bacterium]
MARPKLLAPPAEQNYDCHATGRCCRGYFRVQVTPAEQARIAAQGWEQQPDHAGLQHFVPLGAQTVLANRPDGGCVFLNEQGLCGIHARFGEDQKPLACRLYPFVFVPAGDEIRLDLRYDCPSVAASRGRPAAAHRDYLEGLLKLQLAGRSTSHEAPPLTVGVPADWATFRRLGAALERIVSDLSLDLTRRIVAAVNFSELLRVAPLSSLRGSEQERYVNELVREAVESALDDELPRQPLNLPTRLMFRQLCALYGRADLANEPRRLLRRAVTSLQVVLGGRVPAIQDDFPATRYAAAARLPATLGQSAAEALARYFRTRLHSLGFCGRGFYGTAFLDGLDSLLLLHPIMLWYARYFAAGRGLNQIDDTAVWRAIEVADHNHGKALILNTASERRRRQLLSEPIRLRQLAIWFGT